MTIDYDRLRDELDRYENGDEFRDQRDAMQVLGYYAPYLARELVRLRDELTDLRDLMWTNAGHLRKDGHAIAADWTENHALRLAQIMQGDTE